jgi:hypothetical protein
MEILKGLEEEYKQQQEKRVAINENLEAEGYHTLRDKVQVIGEKATEAAGGASLIEKTKKTLEILHGSAIEKIN